MKKSVYLLMIIILVASTSCVKNKNKKEKPVELHCYIGGTMRPVMEELIKLYRSKSDTRILVDYAGSGELLIRMKATQRGDIYVAHDPFDQAAKRDQIAYSVSSPASLTPVIAVQKGNPMKITGFKDLIKRDISVLIPNSTYSTTGQLVNYMAAKEDMLEQLDKHVATRMRCPCDAANALTLDNADAAIVWNAVVHLRKDKLDMIPIEPTILPQKGVDVVTSATFGKLDLGITKINLIVLNYSRQLKEAQAFVDFAASPANASVWKEFGFSNPEGKEWK